MSDNDVSDNDVRDDDVSADEVAAVLAMWPPEFGVNNKVFTREEAARALVLLRRKLKEIDARQSSYTDDDGRALILRRTAHWDA